MISKYYKKILKVFTVVLVGSVTVLPLNGASGTSSNTSAALSVITNVLLLDGTGRRFAFTADDSSHLRELWISDGTTAGTKMVKDINPSADSEIRYLTVVKGVLYFAARDGVHGMELWKSDGTAAGTVLVKDINPGYAHSYLSNLTNINGVLYFSADDGTHGKELWKSDGTTAGTQMVMNISPNSSSSYPSGFTYYHDGRIFFSAADNTDGYELWSTSTNGVTNYTYEISDINSGSSSSYPQGFIDFGAGDFMYFTADDGTHGDELWVLYIQYNSLFGAYLDYTNLVKDINPAGDSQPRALVKLNGILYFTADDGTHGRELWKSNGSAGGTSMVKDIWQGADDALTMQAIVNINGVLYFSANDGTHGWELWKSDGTKDGTVMVKDIAPNSSSSGAQFLKDMNGVLYFSANDGVHGTELWKSNGTPDGTVMIKDIAPGSNSSNPAEFTYIKGEIYFIANDGANGHELWRSDGTKDGTVMVKDISPLGSSFINEITPF